MLERYISLVVEATEEVFYTDAAEAMVYEQIRSRARDVENAILSINVADTRTYSSMSTSWREIYDDILIKAHELSSVDGNA